MRHALALCALALSACAGGGAPSTVATPSGASSALLADFPGLPAIRDAELRDDLFAMAGESMRGREAGTQDELRASGWLAERARAAGLEPAGEDGTYFQWFPLRRVRQSTTSRITIGDRELALWRDVSVMSTTNTTVEGPILWLGESYDSTRIDVQGRVVAVIANADASAPPLESALAARSYGPRMVSRMSAPLLRRGATAVIVIAGQGLDKYFDMMLSTSIRGSYPQYTAEIRISTAAPVLLMRSSMQSVVAAAGASLSARLTVDQFEYPSVNVVARVRGTDPTLRGQVVLFSGHQDHDGIRATVAGDSSWSGADDNATVSVALLGIARAFVQRPGKRTALFVWHGAEERGLHGSRWHVDHPMVPRDSIVAVLNGDMIGRNHPDTAALLGSIPPHRNSTDLVGMAHEANRRVSAFVIDSTWDRPEHREGWYFRSDHLPYARANIPAVFFTTLLHADYHTPFDNPERIDITKLGKMTKWMYATGWLAANSPQRPRLDPGFRLER